MEFFDFSGTNEEEKAQAQNALTQQSGEVEFFFEYNNHENHPNQTKSIFNLNGGNVNSNGVQHEDEFQGNLPNSDNSSYSNQEDSDNPNQSLSFTSLQQNWEVTNSANIPIQPNGAPIVRGTPQFIYPSAPYPHNIFPHNPVYAISPEHMHTYAAQQQQNSVNSISNQNHLKDKHFRMPSTNNSTSYSKNSNRIASANMPNCDNRNPYYISHPHRYPEMQMMEPNRINAAMPVSVNGDTGMVSSNGVPAHLGHPQHQPAYGFPPTYPALFQSPYPPFYFYHDGPFMHPYPYPPNTASAHMMAGLHHPTLIPSPNSAVDMAQQSNHQPVITQSMSSATTTISNLSSSSNSIAAAYHSSEGSQSDTPTSFDHPNDQVEDSNANINYPYEYSDTSINPQIESYKDDFQQKNEVPTELKNDLQSNTLCPSESDLVPHTVYKNSFPLPDRERQPDLIIKSAETETTESPDVELFSELSSLKISMENETNNSHASNVKNSIIDTLFSSVTNNKPYISPIAQSTEPNSTESSDLKCSTQDSSIISVGNTVPPQPNFSATNSKTWASKLFPTDNYQPLESVNNVKCEVNSDEPNSEPMNEEYPEYTSKMSFVNSQNYNRNYNKNRSPIFDVDNDSTKINIISMNEDPVALGIARRLKDSIKLKHALPTIIPCGLINRGNWCYVNATLQALLACPPFYNLMREISDTPGFFRINTSTPIIDNFVRYFSRFTPSNFKRYNKSVGLSANSFLEEMLRDDPIEPLCVYNTLKHIGMIKNDAQRGHQEDAEEFLSSVLNGLNEEMIGISNLLKKQSESNMNGKMNGIGSDLSDKHEDDEDENSIDPNNDDSMWHEVGTTKHKALPTRSTKMISTAITEIFGGSTLDVRTVNKDNNSSGNRQPFFTLQLDIKPPKITNLEQAIRWQTRSQLIQGYTCSKTKQIVDASSQMFLETLPPILILHLKLFDYDIETGVGRKLLKHINFTENLDIPRECLSRNTDNRACSRYKLLGVVYHDGPEAGKGHYITDVFHLGVNQWLRCDDASISVISLQKVLAVQEGNLVPYLLFYRRQDTLGLRTSSSHAANNVSSSFNSGAHGSFSSNKYGKSSHDYVNTQQTGNHNNHHQPQHHTNQVHNINTSNKFSSISRH